MAGTRPQVPTEVQHRRHTATGIHAHLPHVPGRCAPGKGFIIFIPIKLQGYAIINVYSGAQMGLGVRTLTRIDFNTPQEMFTE